MQLEERIKQNRPFRNQGERLAVNILYTANWLLERFKGHLDIFDITQQQYNVLRILRGQHPNAISTSDIKERMIDKAPDTSRIVDRLITKGLVEKAVCGSDKRRVDVCITKKGMKLLQDIDADEMRIENFTKQLSKKECETLNELLDKLKDAE